MKLEQIKEVLKGYRAPGFSAEITRIAYSGAEDFVFAELPGATPLKITAAVLQQWEIRPFFCIDVTFSGGPGSKMNGQILIPEADWNGKIVSVGNGGPAMTLHYQAELACLYEPYAVIHCDLGTSNIDVGLSSASAVIDHGWRATHLMAVLGKDIVARIYGKPAEHAYFVGMSTGGQQAIASATICPEDFDGIVAIAPAITRSYLHASFVWYTQKLVREDGTPKLTREEIGKIYSKVMEYHARKGYGAPGDAFVSVLFTEQERQEILAELEAGGEFSAEQMEALRALYEGPVNPETGEKVFCGLTMGTEGNMFGIMGHIIPGVFASQLWLGAWINGSLNKEFVGGGYHQFDFAKDVDSPMMRRVSNDMDADSGDLAAFKARGGKLIVIQGISDEFIPAPNTIDWYERVIARQGGLADTQDFCRLFVVPGLSHTSVPNGLNWVSGTKDLEKKLKFFRNLMGFSGAGMVDVIDQWVCGNDAPESLMSTGCVGTVGLTPDILTGINRQRPVYPYPDRAEYVSGDPTLPTSFRRAEGRLGQYEKPRSGRYDVKV